MNTVMSIDVQILKTLPENSNCHILLGNKKLYFKFFIEFYGINFMVVRDNKTIYHIYEEDWYKVKVLDKEMYLN